MGWGGGGGGGEGREGGGGVGGGGGGIVCIAHTHITLWACVCVCVHACRRSVRKVFDAADTDGNGVVDEDEAYEVLCSTKVRV